MNYQWYPGHMTKAMRRMKEDIKLIDIVIEIVDARIPLSSRNPDIDTLANGKARLIILNKSDLSNPKRNSYYNNYFAEQGLYVCSIDSRKKSDMKAVTAKIMEACEKKRQKDLKKGIKNRPLRAMVVGIPNAGKSTFINSFAGKAVAKTGNKPGVTKGKQWIRLNKNVELLDTPGVLWPKFEDEAVGFRIACIGSMNDSIIDTGEIAAGLIKYIVSEYPGLLHARYNIDESDDISEMIEAIAINRQCLRKGSEVDLYKAESIIVDEFRRGVIGRITLE